MTLNAGVQVGIEKVNITIADVEAELELIIRLGNCTFSLNLVCIVTIITIPVES